MKGREEVLQWLGVVLAVAIILGTIVVFAV